MGLGLRNNASHFLIISTANQAKGCFAYWWAAWTVEVPLDYSGDGKLLMPSDIIATTGQCLLHIFVEVQTNLLHCRLKHAQAHNTVLDNDREHQLLVYKFTIQCILSLVCIFSTSKTKCCQQQWQCAISRSLVYPHGACLVASRINRCHWFTIVLEAICRDICVCNLCIQYVTYVIHTMTKSSEDALFKLHLCC